MLLIPGNEAQNTNEKEGQHVPYSVIIRHVIEQGHPEAPPHFSIGREVSDQIPAGGNVAALPRIAHTVEGPGSRARNDRLVQIRSTDNDNGGYRGVGLDRALGDAQGRLLQQLGDHGDNHLHMTKLLRADTEEKVTVLAVNICVPGLKAVLQGNRCLAVPTPSTSCGIRA